MKFDNKKLIFVLVLIVAIYGAVKFFGSQNERNFRTQVIDFDTTDVAMLEILPKNNKSQPIELVREGETWRVKQGEKSAPASQGTINSAIGQLLQVKPQQLAAKNEGKWAQYEVNDSLGTEVTVKDTDGKTLVELVIGKFNFDQQRRSGTSFFRVAGEEETYATNGFLSMAFNHGFDRWRNSVVSKFDQANASNIVMTYPDGETFSLVKEGSKWTSPDVPVDSAKAGRYVNQLANLTHSQYYDREPPQGSPLYRLRIQGNNMDKIEIAAHAGENSDFLIHSTSNPETWFRSDSSSVFDQVFKTPGHFVVGEEVDMSE